MKVLPAHLLKLRWLLSQKAIMKPHDLTYIKDITKILSNVNYQEACPITIFMIDNMYSSYKAFARSKHVSN